MTSTGRLVVAFPEGRGVARWAERDRESPVPGDWPYGLEHLRSGDRDAEALDLPGPSRWQRGLLRLGLPATRRRGTAEVALSWDEVTAAHLLARRPGRRLFSGVIWATDQLACDPASAVLARQRRVLRALDGLWCLSRPQVDAVRDWIGADGPPVHFLPFGIDEQFYRSDAPPPAVPRVVSVGGDRDRDPATLFAALELVRRSRPDVECIVQSRSTLTPPAGVRKVDFIPHAQARDLYASASLVAVATRPNLHASGMTVALEGMSVGRPVVACATPGMADYVRDGVTGLLVTPQRPEEMAAAVLELLEDRERAAEMGRAARRRVLAGFTTTTMCRHLTDLVG
ncbi:glycosyltransferase family 4 protein [Modestobacter sp. KNN46-3]|uniref:glycosyltransferase family 4 protein n=1 Tax=Modestobacter sp. KNN46-3 TaxID=2711218 RepID=UPI0019D2AB75|nr:glycosyltransferase family 4 protein [Modestobacter sp. KNN46-3]